MDAQELYDATLEIRRQNEIMWHMNAVLTAQKTWAQENLKLIGVQTRLTQEIMVICKWAKEQLNKRLDDTHQWNDHIKYIRESSWKIFWDFSNKVTELKESIRTEEETWAESAPQPDLETLTKMTLQEQEVAVDKINSTTLRICQWNTTSQGFMMEWDRYRKPEIQQGFQYCFTLMDSYLEENQ